MLNSAFEELGAVGGKPIGRRVQRDKKRRRRMKIVHAGARRQRGNRTTIEPRWIRFQRA